MYFLFASWIVLLVGIQSDYPNGFLNYFSIREL